MKQNNRSWTSEQDQLLTALVNRSTGSKIKWTDIASVLHSNFGRQKSGKQCRQRWQHQLDPTILKNQWTIPEQHHLFKLQIQFGNKWSMIAQHLPGRTDNAIKNFFYSSIRKVFTKVNYYLIRQRQRKQFKSIRQFSADYLSKLMAVVDGKFDKKVRLVSQETFGLAKEIISLLSGLLNCDSSLLNQIDQKMDNLILMMHQFRKNCKKRKAKKTDEFDRQFILENKKRLQEQQQSFEEESNYSSQQQPNIPSFDANSVNKSSNLQKQQPIQEQINPLQKCKIMDVPTNSTLSTDKSSPLNEISCQGPEQPLFNTFQEGFGHLENNYWEFLDSIPQVKLNDVNKQMIQFAEVQDYLRGWDEPQPFLLLDQSLNLLSRSQPFRLNELARNPSILQASFVMQQCCLTSKKSSFYEGMLKNYSSINME